jgi:hypothetical protein
MLTAPGQLVHAAWLHPGMQETVSVRKIHAVRLESAESREELVRWF